MKIGPPPDAVGPCSIIATFWPVRPPDRARPITTQRTIRTEIAERAAPPGTRGKLSNCRIARLAFSGGRDCSPFYVERRSGQFGFQRVRPVRSRSCHCQGGDIGFTHQRIPAAMAIPKNADKQLHAIKPIPAPGKPLPIQIKPQVTPISPKTGGNKNIERMLHTVPNRITGRSALSLTSFCFGAHQRATTVRAHLRKFGNLTTAIRAII